MKKRIGNDFSFVWILTENGTPVDVSTVVDFALTIKHSSMNFAITPHFDIVDGNAIIECSKGQLTELGKYYLIATWKTPEAYYSDGYRDCAADVDTFEIVPRTSMEDNDGNDITSEVGLGFRGMSSLEVWQIDNPEGTKDDFEAWIRQPATDAAVLANQAAENAIAATTETIAATQLAVEATQLANQATTEANNATAEAIEATQAIVLTDEQISEAEALRVIAEGGRSGAEVIREGNEDDRKENETGRQSAEVTRGENETARQNHESTRQQSETTRGQNEITRQGNEDDRIAAEGLRDTHEGQRVSAETTRGNNETTRISNETTRGTQETARQNQESGRVTAENAREAAIANLISFLEVPIIILDNTTLLATGSGLVAVPISLLLGGRSVSSVHAFVNTASSSGLPTFTVRNLTTGQTITSTPVTIDATELNSYTAVTPHVINPSYKVVSTGDQLAIDCGAAGTGTKGLTIVLKFVP